MPPASVLRSLPPLSPRVPPSKSPSQSLREKTLVSSIDDPAPEHLSVDGDSDLAETTDLVNSDDVEPEYFLFGNNENSVNGGSTSCGSSGSSSCASSLSPGGGSGSSSNHPNGNHHKLKFSWRGKKVSSTDVASVGNASDTGIHYAAQSTTGRALHESAKLALNAGNYETALELFTAILEAQSKRFGNCHASVAAAMHNVGVCRQRMGQHNLAENLLAQAVQIREKTLGRNHVEVAASLSKLGSVRIALNKFEEAFDDLRKALSIAKQNNDGSADGAAPNKTVAQMLCHLACLYFEKGELFAAQATFQDALDIYRQVLKNETDHKTKNALLLQLTDTLCNIGSILNRRKSFGAAISNFQEALDLQRGILEQDHPRIISTLDNLAYSYSKNKEYARAVTCYRTMLRAQVSQTKTFTEECLLTFRKRIIMYEKLKLTSEAINDTKDVIRLQKTLLPKEHAIVVETKALLEDLQARKKKEKKRSSSSSSDLSIPSSSQPVEC